MSMRPPENKLAAEVPPPAAEMGIHNRPKIISKPGQRKQALEIIGAVDQGNCSQVRVGVSHWRGDHKVELRTCTRVFGGIFFPAGPPVTIDPDKVDQLIDLLRKAVA
jgi:hypothetical protein